MSKQQPISLVTEEIRKVLLQLARREDDLACDVAAATPYWAPAPKEVAGHRSAAAALRAEADAFLPPRVGT